MKYAQLCDAAFGPYTVRVLASCCAGRMHELEASCRLGVGQHEEAKRRCWQCDTLTQIQAHGLDRWQCDVINHFHWLSVHRHQPVSTDIHVNTCFNAILVQKAIDIKTKIAHRTTYM